MEESKQAQEALETTSRSIIKGYPLAAGLIPVSDVPSLFPIPRAYPPFLSNSLSAHNSGIDEPLFHQHASQMEAILRGETGEEEIKRVTSVVQADVAMGRRSFQYVPPPPGYTPSISSPSTPRSSLASSLVNALSLDSITPPQPHPSTSAAPSPIHPFTSISSSSTSPDPRQFFSSFLTKRKLAKISMDEMSSEEKVEIPKAKANGHAASSSRPIQRRPSKVKPAAPESSPDPLQITSNTSSSFRPIPSQHSQRSPPASATPSSPHSHSRSSTLSPSKSSSFIGVEIEVPSPRSKSGNDAIGFESAVKRLRVASTSASVVSSSGRGAVRVASTQDLIDKITDLISDLFAADDSFVSDTSTSNLTNGNVDDSTTLSSFFHPTLTTNDSLPIVSLAALKKLIKQLQAVVSKGRGEDFLEETEEGGVGRLLKVLERSWKGVGMEDMTWWEAEAEVEKRIGGGGAMGKGKGKKVKAVTKSKKGKGKKSRPASDEEEEDEEGDEEEEEEYSPRRGLPNGAGQRRSSRSRSRTRSRSPTLRQSEDVEMDDGEAGTDEIWTDQSLATFSENTELLINALHSIRAALLILTSTNLPRHLYSADYITSIITTLRHILNVFLFPLLESPPDSHLADLLSIEGTSISSACEALDPIFPLISSLFINEEMSEEIVISTVYFALSPFFKEASPSTTTTGRSRKVEVGNVVAVAMKGIRVGALGLVRTLWAGYEDQRQWIVQEVLDHLQGLDIARKGKGTLRLRTGVSIHTVSSLLLHLVQTPPSNLQARVQRYFKKRVTPANEDDDKDLSQKMDEDDGEEEEGEGDEEGDEKVKPMRRMVKDLLDPALESSTKTARQIVAFLLHKSCKAGKATTGSTESEYRVVFDNLIADVLAVLHLPEWPAAEFLLTVCTRSLLSTLADPKSSHDLNAVKSLALDHIGPIGSRLQQDAVRAGEDALKSLQDVVSAGDDVALEQLYAAVEKVLAQVAKVERQSGAASSASQFSRALFARDLVNAFDRASTALKQFDPVDLVDTKEGVHATAVYDALHEMNKSIWDFHSDDDVFGPAEDAGQSEADSLSLLLANLQPLAALADPILEQLLVSSESTQVGFRTKSLRGISLFVAQNPELFLQADVRKSIQNRTLDSSPAVRDTAIELVGKYVVGRPTMAMQYLPLISERITDTGLSVRRRVVKLLKSLFGMVESVELQIDICRKLVWRVLDEDDGVKELAVDTIEDIWFSRNFAASRPSSENQNGTKSDVEALAAVIMGVAGVHKDRSPPVDELLRLINEKHLEKGTKWPRERLQLVTESLIDLYVEGPAEDGTPPLDLIACIRTIFILNAADPSLLSTAKATLLLSFLKSATTPDEQITVDYLLKIFRATVLAMPKTQSKFAKDLQARLLPMINKPAPSINTSTLQEIVSCFCAVVRGQTHDFSRMIAVYKACASRLSSEVQKKQSPDQATSDKVNVRSFPMLSYLTSLLCEHGNFDEVRKLYPETAAEINSITPKSTSGFTYSMLVKLYNLRIASAQPAVLTSLGFLFRGYPTLMLDPAAMEIMDTIFDATNPGPQIQLLRIIQDFLASQSNQGAAKPAALKAGAVSSGVKIEELVGNVEGFADSGVASAICQRYTKQILKGCLSSNVQLQRLAVDILTTIGRSGFSHPLTIAPYLIALSGSPDSQLAKKAFSTLSLLHQKHATLLATRFVPSAKVAFEFAQSFAHDSELVGYSGAPFASYFDRWYSLLQKEKRQHQMDYLKAFSRVYEQDPGKPCAEADVAFARFLAEALSTLDFKRLEEPMTIIAFLNAALAVSGLQILHLLEETTDNGAGLVASITPTSSPMKQPLTNGSGSSHPLGNGPAALSADLVRQSFIGGIALLLRDFLKHTYSINDAKMQKFSVGKKSAQGDKPAVRRADAPAALGVDKYARMPLVLRHVEELELLEQQRDVYIALIHDDGTVGALDELEVDDE